MPLLALALLLSAPRAVPALTGPVVDQARMLADDGLERLAALSRAARAAQGGQGVQLQYLLVPSLDGEPIEDFSIRVAEAWKLGTKGSDNGLLFVVAQTEHKFRLEVGGGLEGDLTDLQAQRILDDTLTPAVRRGDYVGGLYRAGVQARRAVHGLPAGLPGGQAFARPDSTRLPVLLLALWFFLRHGGWILLMLFYLFLRLVPYRRYSRTSYYSGGGLWGGGGSSGGGGWSGGGGFSGGGASGGW